MKKIPLNLNWQFSGGDVEILETRKWKRVDLPHDFMIGARRGADADGQSGNGYFPGGMGEYRKRFASPDAKTAFLMIDDAETSETSYSLDFPPKRMSKSSFSMIKAPVS